MKNLDEIAMSNNVRIRHINKLFFKKHSFSLLCRFDDTHLKNQLMERNYKERTFKHCSVTARIKVKNKTIAEQRDFNWNTANSCIAHLPDTFDMTLNPHGFSIYTDDKQTVADAINSISLANTFSRPPCERTRALMKKFSDREVLVRDAWKGTYFYKVFVREYDDESLEAMDKQLSNFDLDLNSKNYIKTNSGRILYLREEDDMFLVKMAIDEKIVKIQQCINDEHSLIGV